MGRAREVLVIAGIFNSFILYIVSKFSNSYDEVFFLLSRHDHVLPLIFT